MRVIRLIGLHPMHSIQFCGSANQCWLCGGTFLHAGGRMKCPARGKKCLTCNKMNHFAKCCRMKGKEDKGVLKAVERDSDSSDGESLCSIEKVGAVKHNQGRRRVSSVTVENREFQVLVDTGATVNVMDEITLKRFLADKVTCHESDSKGKKRKRRLSSFELSEIIVAKEVKTRMQLLAYTNNQKCERKNVIAEFIINRGPLLRRKM